MIGGEMTGRDLILYILQNKLENEPVFKDGKLLGFMNAVEAAIKFDVGESTIRAWMDAGYLPYIRIANRSYIPAEVENPRDILERSRTGNEKRTISN